MPTLETDLAQLDEALAGRHADPELERLVRAVRDEPQAMRPEFVLRLDEKVAHGLTPRASRARMRARMPAWLRFEHRFAVAGAVASVLLALVIGTAALRSAQTTQRDETVALSSDAPAAGPAEEAPAVRSKTAATPDQLEDFEFKSNTSAAAPSSGSGAQSAGAAPPLTRSSTGARKVERNTVLALTAPADELAQAADGVVATTDRFGGIVETSSVSTDDGDGGSASFELRIPAARLQSTLAALSKLAHVRSRSETSLDITAPTETVADRLADARARRASLLRRLARADTDNETASLRARLRDVRGQISSLTEQRERLAGRANFARVSVTLASSGKASDKADDGAWTPGDAWRDARGVLGTLAAGAILVGAVALPALLLAAAALAGRRVLHRRRREGALAG